jgi:hypothetical protein
MTQKFWLSLCQVMGRADLLDDPRFADPNTRATNRAAMTDALDPTFRTHTTAEWLSKLNGLLPPRRFIASIKRWIAPSRGPRAWSPRAASREGRAARARQSSAHRRAAAFAGGLLIPRCRQRVRVGSTSMKLQGIKVVDLSWFLPGPYLTTALADHAPR